MRLSILPLRRNLGKLMCRDWGLVVIRGLWACRPASRMRVGGDWGDCQPEGVD